MAVAPPPGFGRSNERGQSASEQGTSSEDHARLLAELTGGLAPLDLTPFGGSDRLRPDGRPKPEFRARLRRNQDARNAFSVVAILAAPIAIVSTFVWLGSWWLLPLAMLLMGTVFPRLYILNHEAAHRSLFSNRTVNDLVGEKLIGLLAFGDGGSGYRRAHAQHHRDEFGPGEPDFALYARYPVSTASLRRKLTRDAIGVSGWKNLRPIVYGLFRPGYRVRAAKALAGQLFVFALFLLAGQPLLYLLLWFVPWMTYWRVVNRLRSLAEHAGMTQSTDRRATTHHVRQNLVASFFFVPYNTGYHLAHHVDSGVPWRSLPVLHEALVEDGYIEGVTVHRSYRAFWRTLAT